MSDEDIYLKALDIYQARIAALGEARWRVLSLSVTADAGLATYAYTKSSVGIYVIAIILTVALFYLESMHLRIQRAYINKCSHVERAIREIVLKEPNPYIPPRVIDTSPRASDMPTFAEILKPKRAVFWLPYFFLCLVLAVAYIIGFSAGK